MQPESRLQLPEVDTENELLREEEKLVFTLIEKYEDVIKALEQQNAQYRVKLEECTNAVQDIANENANLIFDYKKSLEIQITSLENEDSFIPRETGEFINDLQHQMETLKQEKGQILHAWQLALREIDRLEQRTEDETQPHVAVSHLEYKSAQMKDEYTKIITEQKATIYDLKEEAKKYQTDLHVKNIQITEMRMMVASIKEQCLTKEKRIEEMTRKEFVFKEQIHHLQDTISKLQLKGSESLRESIELREQYAALQEQSKLLIDRNTMLEIGERGLIKKIKENLQIAENAVLEKEEVNMKLQFQQTEVNRLKDSLGQLVDEAGLRTKREVENVHKSYASRINRLEKQVRSLELENNEMQSEIEKAQREKNTAESQFQKLQREYESGELQQSYQQIHTRLVMAERKSNEIFVELDATKIKMKLLEMSHKKESEQWVIEKHHLVENVKWLEKECETHLENKVQLTCDVERLQTQVQQLKQELDTTREKMKDRISLLQSEKKSQDQKWKDKITNLEEYYQNTCHELRQLLAAQQKLSAKWKSEMKLATQSWENRMSDTQLELLQFKQRNMELSSILKDQSRRSNRYNSVPSRSADSKKHKF